MNAERAREASQATEATLERALASLRRAMVTLQRVIAENQALAGMPGHEASARTRLRQAHVELRDIRRRAAELEERIANRVVTD